MCNIIRWNLSNDTKLPHNWNFVLSHNSIVWPDIFGHFLASLRTKISSEVAIRKSLKFCTYDSFCGENCNSGHEVMRKNRKNRFYRFFSRSPLQMFFKLIILMGNNLNNLYLNGQVIWYGGSRDIVKFLQHLSYFQSNRKVGYIESNVEFTWLKASLNYIFLVTKSSSVMPTIVLEKSASLRKPPISRKADREPP